MRKIVGWLQANPQFNAEYGGDDLAMAGIRKQDDGSGVTRDFKVSGHF